MPDYRPVHGTPYTEDDAVIVCPELVQLAHNHGGSLTPTDVLEAARRRRSPLHDYVFSEDVPEAAEKWYKHKAGKLLRAFEVTWTQNREEHRAPLMHYLEVVREPGSEEEGDDEIAPDRRRTPRTTKAYVTITAVMDDPAYQAQVVAKAQEELERFRNRYAEIQNLVDFRTRFGRTFRAICNLFPLSADEDAA